MRVMKFRKGLELWYFTGFDRKDGSVYLSDDVTDALDISGMGEKTFFKVQEQVQEEYDGMVYDGVGEVS